ncbi:MAG: hypothetical protein MJY67_05360 [Bacteroidales bacterium]|nr:hypothetical protein [Bacteroidales bacterium]
MKKFFKIAIAAVAALSLSVVLTSAVASASGLSPQSRVEFTSSQYSYLNCSMELDKVTTIMGLLPQNIKKECRGAYKDIRAKHQNYGSFKYAGVAVKFSQSADYEGLVNINFSYQGNQVKISDVSLEQLDEFFATLGD